MVIKPPEFKLCLEKPYSGAFAGREWFGNSLTSIIEKSEGGLVIFVDSPWGGGKTTFIKMWRRSLELSSRDSVLFDAFENDYVDDPFFAFSGEIVKFAKKHNVAKELETGVLKAAVVVGKRLLGIGGRVALRVGTSALIGSTDLEVLRAVVSETGGAVDKEVEDLVEKWLEERTNEKDVVDAFRLKLTALGADVCAKLKGFPLVVIVDELDRCRPDFALSLLERIKHFFQAKSVCFVVFAHEKQIEECIRTIYGTNRPDCYLQKFYNVSLELPDFSIERKITAQLEYVEELHRHFALNSPTWCASRGIAKMFCEMHPVTLRELEKYYQAVSLARYADLVDSNGAAAILAMLIFFRILDPELFSRLSAKKIQYGELATDLNYRFVANGAESNRSVQTYLPYFRYAMLSEGDYNRAVADGSIRADLIDEFLGEVPRGALISHLAKRIRALKIVAQ